MARLPKITRAVDYSDYYELTVVNLTEAGDETGEPFPYVLYDSDPHGDAPALRYELHVMIDKGEIVAEEPPMQLEALAAPAPRDLLAEIDALKARLAELEGNDHVST